MQLPPRERSLRILAGALAAAAGVGHGILGAVNLIPGESTSGPVFLAIGAGYFAFAALLLLRKTLFDPLALFYALALILAYAASRDGQPVEPLGLAIKGIEAALFLTLLMILRSPRAAERNNSGRDA